MIDNQFHYYYTHAVCLSVNDQHDSVMRTIDDITEKNVLIIMVIYADESTSDAEKSANQNLLHLLKNTYFGMWRSKRKEGVSLHQTGHSGLLLINCSSGKLMMSQDDLLSSNQIAVDAALTLIEQKNVRLPWIHFANAGSQLPPDCFRRAKHLTGDCISYPFYFKDAPHYELAMRHYHTQLQQIGSPYAFYSEQGTFALNTNTFKSILYPNGETAELTLLNNVCKQNTIETLDGNPIVFNYVPKSKTPFYHPDIFKVLKNWLQIMDKLAPFANTKVLQEKIRTHPYSKELSAVITELDAYTAIQNINYKTKDANVIRQQLQNWFDAIKTKQFIDTLHLTHFPEATPVELCQHYGLPSNDLNEVCSFFQPRLETTVA